MVLKKSNTPFNSGATQKCFSRKSYKTVHLKPQGSWLTFTLYRFPEWFEENDPNNTEFVKALEKIYDYLGFSGPNLKTFNEADHYSWDEKRSLSFHLNKEELWSIPERIDSLMEEKNFLEGESGFPEIRVHKVQKLADRETFHKKETVVFNREPKDRKSRRKKRDTKETKRGVQRLHLLTQQTEDNDRHYYDGWGRRKKKVVCVELQMADQIDARILSHRPVSHYSYDYDCWYSNKKVKHGVGSRQMKRNIMDTVVSETMGFEQVWEGIDWYNGGDDYDDDDDEGVDDCQNYAARQGELGDYVSFSTECYSPRKKQKVMNHIGRERTNDDAPLINVNTASSQTTFKHPKGSFQFIKKTQDVMMSTENEASIEENNVNHNDDSIEAEDLSLTDLILQVESKEADPKTSSPMALDPFETYDHAVAISIQFSEFVHKSIMGSYNDVSVNGYSLEVGNCYPPVFSLSLTNNDVGLDNEWNLIGTSSSDVSDNKNLKWEVTLKNTTSSHTGVNVKRIFFDNLDSTQNDIMSLTDLVQLALDAIQSSSCNSEKDNNVPPNTLAHTPYCQTDLIEILGLEKDSSANVCSMKEAVTRLQSAQRVIISNFVQPLTKNSNNIYNESIECDICFDICDKYGLKNAGIITLLPCNHSFCSECWRSHVLHHLMTGHMEFKCMDTDCKETLDDTLVKALIPEQYLAKLYLHRQENIIETSPLCRWCPKTKCDKVAMITETNPHVKQFGCRVVCDCLGSWCFSCQADPHWPASCSQTAAYRKLQQKLRDEIPLDVSCDVELKPCPACGYPIEKNEGCPHMTCRMCNFEFCWKCLQSVYDHYTWSCTEDEDSRFKTYHLENNVVDQFPLKFFRNSLDMKKRLKSVKKNSVRGWLLGLNAVDCSKLKLPFELSVQLEEASTVKKRTVLLATDSLRFLTDSYRFMEYFYLLYSFALLNEDESSSEVSSLSIRRTTDKLVSITSRLEECVVGKTFRQLMAAEKRCQVILDAGVELLEKLRTRVATFQKLSKNVPAEPIGLLDPTDFYNLK